MSAEAMIEPTSQIAVHRALAELGSELEVGELEIFPQPDVYIARLRRRTP